MHAGSAFVEGQRFDRHGLFGRSRLSSLATLNAALFREGSTDWVVLAGRLVAASPLAQSDMQRVDHLWWFGRLIANTDMHTGHLGFRPLHTLALAPAYDLLPMLHAPCWAAPASHGPANKRRPRRTKTAATTSAAACAHGWKAVCSAPS